MGLIKKLLAKFTMHKRIDFDNFDKKIAINGTTKMINNLFGIPEKIYKITIKLFSEESCDKFISNIFNEKIDKNIKITRTLEELKEELVSIQNIILKEEVVFDKAIISLADKIVPTKNQLAFWKNKSEIVKINAPHYPFKNFKSWDELLC